MDENKAPSKGFSLFENNQLLLVFCSGLFLFDQLVDQSRDGSTADTPWRLRSGPVGISHMPQVKRLLGPDVTVIVESDLAAFAALKIFCHLSSLRSSLFRLLPALWSHPWFTSNRENSRIEISFLESSPVSDWRLAWGTKLQHYSKPGYHLAWKSPILLPTRFHLSQILLAAVFFSTPSVFITFIVAGCHKLAVL